MTRSDLLPSTEEEEKTGPVKRWRNRYLLDCAMLFTDGEFWPAGTIEHGCYVSKERAEMRAVEWIRRITAINPAHGVIYLGAFPLTDE